MSLTAAYSPGNKSKELVCVEINNTYALSGGYIPSGGGVQGTFNSALLLPIVATVTVAAGGTVAPAGPSFVLGGASTNYLVTITFNRKFSGSFSLIGTSMDNSTVVGIDKFCNTSIGNPDVIPIDGEVIGNCFQGLFGSNPATPKTFTWSEINDVTVITFSFQRLNIGSTVNLSIGLVEKVVKQWEKNDSPVSYKDPETNTSYTTLPTGVFEVLCKEDNSVAFYTKELCYEVTDPIAWSICGSPGEPLSPYTYQRPRTDGIPFLGYTITGSFVYEFNAAGTYLYSVFGGVILRQGFNSNFLPSAIIPTTLQFIGFIAGAGYDPVGIALHPTTDVPYVMFRDPGTARLYLTTVINGYVELIGDCQFTSAVAPIVDRNDITFTNSGQLLYAHGQNIYLVNTTTGVINSGSPIVIPAISGNPFGIGQLSRFANGDILISGNENTIGSFIHIMDGEDYSIKRSWSSATSLTPPICPFSIAYPKNTTVKFDRVFVKNIETNTVSYDDRDSVTGALLNLPNNVIPGVCDNNVNSEVSWVEDLCYVIDKNVLSQGIINLVGNQLNTDPTCYGIGGFVSPPAVTLSTFTLTRPGNGLYAVNTIGPALEFYTLLAPSTPTFFSTIGLVGILGTIKSIRTRWSDDTLWIMTEEGVGAVRNFRFYVINPTTGAATLKYIASYPAGSTNNGSFTWGIDDIPYFSYNIGGGNYRISKLSPTNMYITDYVVDVPYVVDNLNTDIPNQRLILTKSVALGLDFLTYDGILIEQNCGGVIAQDAMHVPLTNFQPGDTIVKIKAVFIKDLVTGEVSKAYHDFNTGQDVYLPPFARFVNCETSSISVKSSIPRAQLVSGLNSWNKNLIAPNAKSITLLRIANNIQINDGIGVSAVNIAFSTTWTADKLGGNLIFTGLAAGSSFLVSWIEA